MNNSDRYEALDVLRAFSCIGIVLLHIWANSKYDLSGAIFTKLIPAFSNLVFLFMTISAFGMCCGYFDKFVSKQVDISDFYSKRYKKILPFFAMLCVIDVLMNPSINSLYELFANITLCFGLIPNADITVIGVGWFLGTVFAFYILFPFFVFLLSERKRAWIGFATSIIMNYLCEVYFHVGRKAIVYSFVYFMVGGMVYLYRNEIKDNKIVMYVSFLGLLASISCYFIFYSNLTIVLSNAFILILAINFNGRKVLASRVVCFIANISFEIYLCHMVIYRGVEKLHLIRLTGNDYLNYFITFCLVFGGACAFAYIGKIIVEKMMNILMKRRLV